MLEYYIFTSFLLYQGLAIPLSRTECNGEECDDFPDCSNNSCPCLQPSKIYCDIYYTCINDMAQKFSCSPGLLFDEDKLTCDYEKKVECKNRTVVPPSVSPTQQVSTVKDLDLHTTIKYTYISEADTPITITSSSQTDAQEITESNSTLTTEDTDEIKTVTSISTANITEKSSSTIDQEILSTTLQTNITDQSPVIYEITSETTNQSQVSDEAVSETTNQSRVSNDDTSETIKQSTNEVTSEATSQSQDEETTVSVSIADQSTEHSKSTAKFNTEELITEKITTLSTINTDTSQINSTQSTIITSDTFSVSFTKHGSTSTTPELISTPGQPSEETTDGNEPIYNFTCPSRFGLFPDLKNCNFFYQCSHFLPYHIQCPSDLHFNPVLQVCDWPYEAGCENATSKELEITSTKIFSSTFPPTNVSVPSSSIAYTTNRDITFHEIKSTLSSILSTIKSNLSTEKESLPTKDVTQTENLLTSSMIDIITSKPHSTQETVDTKTITLSIIDNLTSTDISSDRTSPNENITLLPQTDNDETSVNMTVSSEKTNKFDFTSTNRVTNGERIVTEKTSSSKLITTEVGLTDTTLNPQTKTDSSEITNNFETSINDLTTKETEIKFSTEETLSENDMNGTTLNPEFKTDSVESSSKSDPTETNNASDVEISSEPIATDMSTEFETIETKIVTLFENVTEGNKITPELKTSSEKTDFEHTQTVTDLQSSTFQNNFTSSTFEILSTIYQNITSDHDQSTDYNITSNNTATQVTFTTKSVGPTNPVPLVNMTTQSTDGIIVSNTNVFVTDGTTQPDKMNLTTETLPEETSSDEILQNFTCISRFGLFPDPENCNYFYQCSHFIPYHLQCPSDLHFNPVLEVCDWPYEAGCGVNSTDTSKETDNDFTTRNNTILTEIVFTESETEPNEIPTSLKPTYEPNSTAPPDITFNETTSKTNNYRSTIITNSTLEVDTEITTKNSSNYSTIDFTNSTKQAEFETSSTKQEFVTKNGSDYSTVNFTKSTKEIEIETSTLEHEVSTTTKNNDDYSTISFTNSTEDPEINTSSSTEQGFVTNNETDYSTISFTNSTKEVESETTNSDNEVLSTNKNDFSTLNFTKPTKAETEGTNSDEQENTTENNNDDSTITSTNSTKTEIVTASELQELTSKSQATETENITISLTNDDKLVTIYDYNSTRRKTSGTAETITETLFIKQSSTDQTEQPLDFECPSRFGLYPDLQNCSRFYQCSHWIVNHMNCPPELHFNPNLQVCDWPIDAGCENITATEFPATESEADFDCPSRFGLFPDKSNCARFFQCSQWISYPKQCSPGLHFNADLKVCDSPYEAGCDKSLISNEETKNIEEK